MYLKMRVDGLVLDKKTKSPVVVLKDLEERYTLPIWIGIFEASSILYALEGVEPPRPMTHDLTLELASRLGATIKRIDVDELEEDVFHAKLHLVDLSGETTLVDSRPSDAIALALRCDADIYADEKVLRSADAVEVTDGHAGDVPHGDLEEYLRNLDSDSFGKYKM